MDVADLVDLVAAARVAAEDALVIAAVGVVNVPHALAHVQLHVAGVLVAVTDVVMNVVDAMGAVDHARVVLGALDVEDLVLVHVQQVVKVRHVQHAIVALGVLVHARHVHHVAVVAVVAVADQLVPHAMAHALEAVVYHVVVVVGVRAAVNRHAQLDARDAQDAQEDAQDAQEDVVLDVTAHVLEIVTDVVMDVVVDVKTHAQQLALQHALEHVKLKRLAP